MRKMPKLEEFRKALGREASEPVTVIALALFLGSLALWAATIAECVGPSP